MSVARKFTSPRRDPCGETTRFCRDEGHFCARRITALNTTLMGVFSLHGTSVKMSYLVQRHGAAERSGQDRHNTSRA